MSGDYELLVRVDPTRSRLVMFGADGDGLYVMTKG